MAYNHGREDRKWRIWKEAEEKLLRECGVDEATIEQIRMADRADFNSNMALRFSSGKVRIASRSSFGVIFFPALSKAISPLKYSSKV